MIFKKKWILAIILALAIAPTSATVISNLNVIFETFSPLSMVRFFEFNDIGWNISEKCIKDMFLYLDGLHKDVLWAVKCMWKLLCFYSLICDSSNYTKIDLELMSLSFLPILSVSSFKISSNEWIRLTQMLEFNSINGSKWARSVIKHTPLKRQQLYGFHIRFKTNFLY